MAVDFCGWLHSFWQLCGNFWEYHYIEFGTQDFGTGVSIADNETSRKPKKVWISVSQDGTPPDDFNMAGATVMHHGIVIYCNTDQPSCTVDFVVQA